MSNDLPLLTSLTENATSHIVHPEWEVPVSAGGAENHVLPLVLLGVFAGGTLVLLSLLVLFCHSCCAGGRRYSRASDDPEKTNTTYVEDSQPTQEITVRLEESEGFSATSCQDGETERFVSTGFTGRRVSFNESALYEQERSNEDKGRRYTLTEGDFHHLKKARLTLHLAPVHMKIVTITECESTESSTVNINQMPASRPPLSIYQRGVASDWMGPSLSGGLPGDPHHSVVLDHSDTQISSVAKTQHTRSLTVEAIGEKGEGEEERGVRERDVSPAQTSVLQFFSKLRRHASLEGAAPYFKKWKFDGHRAASLDAKGSPKRRPFQRQRAASETTDYTEDSSSPVGGAITPPHMQSGVLQSLSAESLPNTMAPPSPSAFNRLDVKVMAEVEVGISNITHYPNNNPNDQREGKGRGRGAGSETQIELDSMFCLVSAAGVQRPPEDDDVEEDDLFEEQDNTDVQRNIEMTSQKNPVLGAKADHVTSDGKKGDEAEEGAEEVLGATARRRTGSGSSLSYTFHQEGSELPPSLYRDIWSLRASLEQYASSDQSSTDRDSIRSDADSISSVGAAGARSGLDSCLSQDLGDEPDMEGEGDGFVGLARGSFGGDGDAATGAGGEGETGSRKLLQMDSGYASIEAPSRAPEELRLFGTSGGSRGKTASERRLFFTSSGRKGSVCESLEGSMFPEEQEDEVIDGTEVEEKQLMPQMTGSQSLTYKPPAQLGKVTRTENPPESLHPQSQPTSPLVKPPHPLPQPSPTHRPRLRRRDYSIDEKTDALFSEFLRHDPRFDQQDSPPRSRHRTRVHLRKQWQRHKQYSDPGSGTGGRYSPSLERQRFTPLRRGDSAGYPLDTRYHSTLSRIASAADEEANEEAKKEAMEDKDLASERGSGEVILPLSHTASEDKVKKVGTSSTESKSRGNYHEVATENTAVRLRNTSGSQAGAADPRASNQNNNSSQAFKSDLSSPEKQHHVKQSTYVTVVEPSTTPTQTDRHPLPAASPSPLIPILHAQSSLTDKLAVSLEERLYSGLRNAEPHPGPGGTRGVTVSHTASPENSPV